MKFATKYLLTVAVVIVAAAMTVLALMGRIAEFWFIPAIIAIVVSLPMLWSYTIPFGERKEKEWAERGKALLEKEKAEKGEDK